MIPVEDAAVFECNAAHGNTERDWPRLYHSKTPEPDPIPAWHAEEIAANKLDFYWVPIRTTDEKASSARKRGRSADSAEVSSTPVKRAKKAPLKKTGKAPTPDLSEEEEQPAKPTRKAEKQTLILDSSEDEEQPAKPARKTKNKAPIPDSPEDEEPAKSARKPKQPAQPVRNPTKKPAARVTGTGPKIVTPGGSHKGQPTSKAEPPHTSETEKTYIDLSESEEEYAPTTK